MATKLLLTDSGITNQSIRAALVDLLGGPIADATALCIPTAAYGHPAAGPRAAYQWIAGPNPNPMVELEWKSMGVLELTALPSIERKHWVPKVQETDVLLVGGGDATYLYHWMRQSGLDELLPELDVVWVGMSGGSMVLTPRIGPEFVRWNPEGGSDRTMGLVDFAIFPHLDYPGFLQNTMEHAEKWAANIGIPSYAIDYETAIKVTDDAAEVISEGHWRQFTP